MVNKAREVQNPIFKVYTFIHFLYVKIYITLPFWLQMCMHVKKKFKTVVLNILIIYEKVFSGTRLLSNFYKINDLWLSYFSELLGKVLVIQSGLSSILGKVRLEILNWFGRAIFYILIFQKSLKMFLSYWHL